MSGVERCTSTCPVRPTPEGMPIETVRNSPRYRHLLEPGARCELEEGHEGRHASAPLYWWSPPIVVTIAKRM